MEALHMKSEQYKKIIIQMIQKIDDIDILIKVYTVVKYLIS